MSEIFEIDSIDFYDWDFLDKLHKKRAKKYLSLCSKVNDGDLRAQEALVKHQKEEQILKVKSRVSGYYWT